MGMNYRTFADMAALIRANIHRIPRVDAVVGIPRSGMIAASMIATLTNQKLKSTNDLGSGTIDSILLVDDSVAGGTTMATALYQIQDWHPHAKITTLAVFVKPESAIGDIFFEVVPCPRVFEWNWHRSKYLTGAILDIDGVISTPTTPGEREKGTLLYRPARRPLALATGRHEYERDVTTDWLAKYDLDTITLYMSNPCQKAQETKVRACEVLKPKWFVESSLHQAEYIHAKTGLPVLCVDANKLICS
jgi:hypoxanthine phosphoribosyltransferase